MLHCLLHSHLNASSPFHPFSHHVRRLASSSKVIPLPPIPSSFRVPKLKSLRGGSCLRVTSSLLEAPVIWVGRLCIFYALLKAGLAGSQSNPLVPSDLSDDGDDLGFANWIGMLRGRSGDKEATDRRKLVRKWHPTTKGTLKRNYRVPSKAEGQRLLRAVASLLSEDDHFVDATSHKGCQIRRESAHGESVCCNNVRALFDELPTPHLVVEITAFPAGPLTDKDYVKAEKLERVLRSGSSI
ncbi:uncharacterized protein LOC122047421 [Zingiber officinale]|uniref:Uncharacterized protein n=1 Tax=Zingiber officinale TaxID=94328 RepID=A0A8J5HJX9_ZINOF|nr:uncharacterized protein LOC122047421 [Zingiber officinale]KAG6526182.1 hypothetical protein ZIOFF_016159 [Zingiber officinale]